MRCKIILDDYDWEDDTQLEIPMEDLVIYELHVRGYTKDPSSPSRYKGTYAAIVDMIPYFKELGINCVELLPVFEFDEMEETLYLDGDKRLNYWGYSTISFFAPKSSYAYSGAHGMAADEMKNMIKKLHKNGIEVILDVVFNHTAEMGDDGPVLSYKGIDNRTYYHLNEKGGYMNYSGCGNAVNCKTP